jgi:glucose/arabinose dehydrogenase
MPTDFAFLPSGRVVITEKNGVVLVASVQTGGTRVALDIRSRVSTDDIRGLLTVTVDPAFPRKPYLYVLYTAAARKEGAPTRLNVSRFTWSNGRLDASSEKVILAATLPLYHAGGQIAFAPDGTMFIAIGDGGHDPNKPAALVAQDVDKPLGKVLHVTRDGKGVPRNPFWNGDATATRSKVWALGFRNPFRLTLEPGTETPVVGDAGYLKSEELSVARRGTNNGWPCYEGTLRGPENYPKTHVCQTLYARGSRAVNEPLVSFNRKHAAVIVGGAFVDGKQVGASVRSAYVFADFARGWLRYLAVRDAKLDDRPVNFGRRLSGPVAIHVDRDGALCYLSMPSGELRRIERVR